MGIIKVYLKESGSISKIEKDFQLYKGSYQNNQIDIYVPITILPSAEQHIAGVKTALIITKPNGDQTTTTSYNAELDTERGEVVVNNVTYVVYTQTLPRVFVKYSGEQTLVANVYEIDDNPESSTYEQIVRIITSQTSPLTIQNSEYIDTEEVQDPSQLEYLAAKVNQLDAELQDKQDKIDDEIEIAEGSVVGAINNLDGRVESNTEQISTNTSDIAELQDIVGSGEDYVGTYTDTKDPSVPTDLADIKEELTAYVETLRPEVEGGDVVIYIQRVSGGTDKNYKFIYSGSLHDWTYYEIPAIERAGNDTYGIIKGTYSVGSTNDVLVDIAGGTIREIYIKNSSGVYNTAKYYVDSAKTSIDNILDGTTPVEKALKAVSDELGNNIVNTYLTQTAGVTKVQLREYALPRTFNDVSYLTSTGYSDTVPESASPVYTVTSTSVGDHELFSAEKTIVNSEFELSEKNSSVDTIYVSASAICNVQFRLTTEINVDNTWNTASVELSDNIQFSAANEIKKLTFGSTFAALEEVLKLTDGDKIRQTLEVITSVSSSITFNVYSNETYPSTFYLNTTSQTIYVAQGKLGELPSLTLQGVYNSQDDKITFTIPEGFAINNNAQVLFLLELPSDNAIDGDTSVEFVQGIQTIDFYAPINIETANGLTLKDLYGVTNSDGSYLAFTGIFNVSNGGVSLLADVENTTEIREELSALGLTVQGLIQSAVFKAFAPTSTTLTNTEFATIRDNDCVLTTSLTLSDKTLVAGTILTKPFEYNGTLRGLYIMNSKIGTYLITISTQEFGVGANDIVLNGVAQINNSAISGALVDTGSQQTIESKKTFKAETEWETSTSGSGTNKLSIKNDNGYNAKVKMGSAENIRLMTNGTYFGTNIGPVTDNAYDLSSSNARWKDLYLSGLIDFGSNAIVYKDSSNRIAIKYSNSDKIKVGSQDTLFANRVTPDSNNTYDLGRSGVYWRDLYLNGGIYNSNGVYIHTNDMATKTFVNSSIATNTANFIGTYDDKHLLQTGYVATGSVLGAGTHIASLSYLNNTFITGSSGLDLEEDVTITSKTLLNSKADDYTTLQDCTFAAGSIINNELYESTTTVSYDEIKPITNNDYAFLINRVYQTDYNSVNDLNALLSNEVDLINNDYAYVINGSKFDLYKYDEARWEWVLVQSNINKGDVPTPTVYNRYKNDGGGVNLLNWEYEYTLNNSSFTAAQWAAINSGMTSALVSQISTNAGDISNLQSGKQNTIDSLHKLSSDLVDDTNATNKFVTSADITNWNGKESTTNKVTSLSSASTDTQYPSAKCVYDLVGDVETLLIALNSGQGV